MTRIHERQRHDEAHDRSQVADRKSQSRHEAQLIGRSDVRQVRVVIDLRALETEIRERDQGKALQDHARLQRGEQRDADNAQQRKRDKKTLAQPGTIGERAEQRSGQHHKQ